MTNVTVLACRLAGEDSLTSKTYDLRTPVLTDDWAYWRALNDAWGSPDVLVNVEHDMEFSDELVRGLVDCPHPLCTYPYLCYIAHRRYYVYSPGLDGRWVEEGVEWADTATLGFVKIAPDVRQQPLRRMIWKFLEHSVCVAVSGFSQVEKHADASRRAWHVHWPAIRHLHDYDADAREQMSDWERFCEENGERCHALPSDIHDVRSAVMETAVLMETAWRPT